MLRISGALRRRIGYITDVEGDFSYFQRYVCISRVVKWEGESPPDAQVDTNKSRDAQGVDLRNGAVRWAPLQSPVVPRQTSPTAPAAASAPRSCPFPSPEGGGTPTSSPQTPVVDAQQDGGEPPYSHLIDVSRYRLTFQDKTSHFVFGGDAFDHGDDLTFGHVLLDFKRRFPARVHLLLGNRDANKMVLYPRIALGVAGMEADAAENNCFTLPPLSEDERAAAAMMEQLRYKDYLLLQRHPAPLTAPETATITATASPSNAGAGEQLVADRVTFLQWALKHKLGCSNTFEHRRHELEALRRLRDSSDASHRGGAVVVSDSEVADSFFTAAQPGGVYYEYLRASVLSVVLDGVLFVHGGVNGRNAGFLPSLAATTYAEQRVAGEWWLPELQPGPAAAEVGERVARAPSPAHTLTPPTPTAKGKSALEWLSALSSFKVTAFQEWASGTGRCGEALRGYVYPRVVAPHSIAVGTVMEQDGPHHICLPVAAYLAESGIHTICGGHQPVGDTPAVVRQPGGLMIVDADTSYCGRGNAFCSHCNKRGAAVVELVFDSGDDSEADAAVSDHGEASPPSTATSSLVVHGLRADGEPYEMDLFADLRVGRCVGDGWWVRLPPSVAPSQHAGYYELRRTRDGFRHEEARWATAEEIDELLLQAAASGRATVEGEIAPRYTKAELAEVRVHRLKSKVSR
ncbi:hypothetical protein ABL78_7298 [Leptomonas seymouri]|uniref:Calcineurin-like phosphoesterase domain-containing protein n=1 Tax=Leptomonas seymouri TaxID=5684 RepID=A0A0N0P332_LEPSE|nr:hypothetical protein ABL78_7298 [Leptomonas seymouri]|eukprot:KPI83659.1 hypothetical protein ABL78_7298 [Leptomonas seymouri]